MTAASASADPDERTARTSAALNSRAISATVWPSRWSPSAVSAHAAVVSLLTPAEILIAARRLAGARPHLAVMAGIAHHEDLWQLCRDELTGVEVRTAAGVSAAAGSA